MYDLETVATLYNVAPQTITDLVHTTVAPLAQQRYYHYLIARNGEGMADQDKPARSVVLFRSPDDALAFAQQARISTVPRVRAVEATAVVLRLLADDSLAQLIFLDESLDALPPNLSIASLGDLPGACVVRRESLLTQLQPDPYLTPL